MKLMANIGFEIWTILYRLEAIISSTSEIGFWIKYALNPHLATLWDGRRPKHAFDPPLRLAGPHLRSTGPAGSSTRLTAPLVVNTQTIVGRGGEKCSDRHRG